MADPKFNQCAELDRPLSEAQKACRLASLHAFLQCTLIYISYIQRWQPLLHAPAFPLLTGTAVPHARSVQPGIADDRPVRPVSQAEPAIYGSVPRSTGRRRCTQH